MRQITVSVACIVYYRCVVCLFRHMTYYSYYVICILADRTHQKLQVDAQTKVVKGYGRVSWQDQFDATLLLKQSGYSNWVISSGAATSKSAKRRIVPCHCFCTQPVTMPWSCSQLLSYLGQCSAVSTFTLKGPLRKWVQMDNHRCRQTIRLGEQQASEQICRQLQATRQTASIGIW
jgi:hypothetical protein